MNRRILACIFLVPVLFAAWVGLSRHNVSKARSVSNGTSSPTTSTSTSTAPNPNATTTTAAGDMKASVEAVKQSRVVLAQLLVARKLEGLEKKLVAAYFAAEKASKEASENYVKTLGTFEKALNRASQNSGPVENDFEAARQAKLNIDAAEANSKKLAEECKATEKVFRDNREEWFHALGDLSAVRREREEAVAKLLAPGTWFRSTRVEQIVLEAELGVVKELLSGKSDSTLLKNYEAAAADLAQKLQEYSTCETEARNSPDVYELESNFRKAAEALLTQPYTKERAAEFEKLRENGRRIAKLREEHDQATRKTSAAYEALKQSSSRYNDALTELFDSVVGEGGR